MCYRAGKYNVHFVTVAVFFSLPSYYFIADKKFPKINTFHNPRHATCSRIENFSRVIYTDFFLLSVCVIFYQMDFRSRFYAHKRRRKRIIFTFRTGFANDLRHLLFVLRSSIVAHNGFSHDMRRTTTKPLVGPTVPAFYIPILCCLSKLVEYDFNRITLVRYNKQ